MAARHRPTLRRRALAAARNPWRLPERSTTGARARRRRTPHLANALAKLSIRDHELVALRYGADLTAAQIGVSLDLSTNATEVALHRALARLRELLEASDAERPVRPPVRVPLPRAGNSSERRIRLERGGIGEGSLETSTRDGLGA